MSGNGGDTRRAFKFQITPKAHEGKQTICQLSLEHEIHAYLIRSWKWQLQEDGPRDFSSNGEGRQREQEPQEAKLYEQIGWLKMEPEWLKTIYPLRSQ